MNEPHDIVLATSDQIFKALLAVDDPYADDAKALVQFLRERGYSFTLRGLSAYYDELSRRYAHGEIKASTFNKRVAGAKKRVRQLLAHGNPALSAADRYRIEEALTSFKTARTRGLAVDSDRLPDDDELARLVRETSDPLVAALVPFLAETGLRISEALEIRHSDIVRAKGFCRITIRGKGKKEREILVASWLLDRLHAQFHGTTFLFEHHERTYSRIATTERIKAESRAILGRPLSAHVFRHYFATRLLREGKSLKAVSRFLGHASTQTTADIYQHDSLAWEDLDNSSRRTFYGNNIDKEST